MKHLEVKDPSISEILGLTTYKDKLNNLQKLAIIKACLRMGCEVNEIGTNGYHPLHIAIKKRYDDIAMILIQHNADITFRDRTGFDPFELAISIGNLKLAHVIHKAGYPYHRGSPPPIKLLQHHAKLYEFEMQLR